ncbi:MAG: PAS domain S-box protein, partial [Chloroflexota bacterium]
HVLVMLDFSPQKRVFVQRLTISAAVSAALLAVLLGLVYLLLYQADKFVYQQQISLGESDDRFHQMFNQDNSAMLLVETGTGKILDANKAASLFYGYPADKLKSMNMSSIDCTRQEQLVHEQDAFNRSEKNHLILQHRLASGNIRDVMVYDSVINYLRQQVTFLVIEDVTERTIAEKALQHENQSLSNLLSLSEQFIENAGLEVNFEKLTRSVLQLTNGWAVIFNMYDLQDNNLQTRAVAGAGEKLIQAGAILGFDLIGKKWPFDITREKSIQDQTITVFPTLAAIPTDNVPSTLMEKVIKFFKAGQVAVAKITFNNRVFGDFTIIMEEGKEFTAGRLLEVYLRQVGLMVERNLEETARLKSEHSLQIAKDSARFGVIDYDLINRNVYMDEMAREIWGEKQDRMFNNWELSERIHPDDLAAVIEIMTKAASEQGNENTYFECRVMNPDGGYRWAALSGRMKFIEGKAVGLNGIIQEISTRKEIEGALVESEDRYQQLFDHSLDGVLLMDEDGVITSANPAAEKIFGCSGSELNILSRQPSGDQLRQTIAVQELLHSGSNQHTEIWTRKADGTAILLDVTTSQFTDRSSRKSIGLTIRDITANRKLEDQLKESTALLNSLMLYSPIYLFIKEIIDGRSVVRMASENYQEMLGIPGSKMAGYANE